MHNELLIFEFGVALLLAGLVYKVVGKIKKRRKRNSVSEIDEDAHWI